MSKLDKIREIIKKHLEEQTATGTGSSYTSGPSGENTDTPIAAGKAPNYYVKKLGYKLVNKNKLHKDAHGVDVKQLWNEGEEPTSAFDLESYISTLPTDDEEVKKYIAGHLGDYNTISSKLKQLITLIGDAKKDDINTYRQNPQMRTVYGTDLAIELLNDLTDLFTK
jgi:hypothetical protein